jgi:hypothetical protein
MPLQRRRHRAGDDRRQRRVVELAVELTARLL